MAADSRDEGEPVSVSYKRRRRPHEFSRIIVCATCRRPLRVMLPNGIPYYKDTSVVRKLDCSLSEPLSVRGSTVK